VKVRYVEGLAIHSGPESCAGAREGVSEALTGVRTGQPLSRDRKMIPSADVVSCAEGNMTRRVMRAPLSTRRGQRTWHVRMFLAREPGYLWLDHLPHQRGGPYREGEEP